MPKGPRLSGKFTERTRKIRGVPRKVRVRKVKGKEKIRMVKPKR